MEELKDAHAEFVPSWRAGGRSKKAAVRPSEPETQLNQRRGRLPL